MTRNPGPTKKLDPTPRRIEELTDLVTAANDWSPPQSFLHRLVYAGDVNGVYTSLQSGTLTRYLPAAPRTRSSRPRTRPPHLADVFGADPALYLEAAEVLRRYRPASR